MLPLKTIIRKFYSKVSNVLDGEINTQGSVEKRRNVALGVRDEGGIRSFEKDDSEFCEKVDTFKNFWVDGYYCGSTGHIMQDGVKRNIQRREEKPFDYYTHRHPKESKRKSEIGSWLK